MELDLDTFLVTVYCAIDDLYRERYAAAKPARRGAGAVLAQWQPRNSESAFVRYAAAHWRAYFPRLLSQEAFNRRVRDLGGVLAALGPAVAALLQAQRGGGAAYQVWDG